MRKNNLAKEKLSLKRWFSPSFNEDVIWLVNSTTAKTNPGIHLVEQSVSASGRDVAEEGI